MIYTPDAKLTGVASLADIGVTTGATTGTGAFSQDSVDGKLTIDPNALASAMASNPNRVKAMLQSFAQSFSTVVNSIAAPGGTIDARIQGDTSQINDLTNQIAN